MRVFDFVQFVLTRVCSFCFTSRPKLSALVLSHAGFFAVLRPGDRPFRRNWLCLFSAVCGAAISVEAQTQNIVVPNAFETGPGEGGQDPLRQEPDIRAYTPQLSFFRRCQTAALSRNLPSVSMKAIVMNLVVRSRPWRFEWQPRHPSHR